MNYGFVATGQSALLFCSMVAALEVGARFAARSGKESEQGASTIEAGVFALLGLLVALTFSGAAERINSRATLVIDEADSLGTGFMRLDLLDKADRDPLRRLTRDYTSARIAEIDSISDDAAHELRIAETTARRDALWDKLAPAAGRAKYPHASQLVLSQFNDAFDVAGRREAVRRLHPVDAVYVLLFVVSVLSALLAGFGLNDVKRRRWLHRLSLSGATAATLFVTLNMEHPRLGVIRMGERDRVLSETLDEMDRIIRR